MNIVLTFIGSSIFSEVDSSIVSSSNLPLNDMVGVSLL